MFNKNIFAPFRLNLRILNRTLTLTTSNKSIIPYSVLFALFMETLAWLFAFAAKPRRSTRLTGGLAEALDGELELAGAGGGQLAAVGLLRLSNK